LIAEMARFEKHRSDSFWDSTTPTDVAAGPPGPTSVGDHTGTVQLAAGANIGQFEWDLRLLYHRDIAPWSLVRPDPCQLLFFHTGRPDGMRIVRLTTEEALVVGAMTPANAVSVALLRGAVSGDLDVYSLLERLVWQEVAKWV
jgi:hypothetical protein